MRSPSKSRLGFSLVEIVIAIGITAFTLATIAGIFGITSQSAQDSTRDTLMTAMIAQVMSDIRPLPFDTLWNADPRSQIATYMASLKSGSTPAVPVPPQNSKSPATSYYYFTSEGVMIVPPSTSTTPSSPTSFLATLPPATADHLPTLYRCQVIKTPDLATQSFVPAGNTPVYNRLQLTLRFDWPVPSTAKAVGPNTKMVYESVARYF